MTKSSEFTPDISIIITAHREGLIAHKTMRSVERACQALRENNISFEVLVSIDRGDTTTKNYFKKRQSEQLLTIYEWDFGDLGMSRNAIIKKASGKYISLIDADDIMSQNWLTSAIAALDQKEYGTTIAHSSYTVEFGDADSVVVKYGATDRDQDILLSVWSGRWNSVIVAPRSIFHKYQYEANSPGYGYEDWHMSCNFLDDGLDNILIPETVIFVRRKFTGSEWLRQKTARAVLHAHKIFLPSSIKSLDADHVPLPSIKKASSIKQKIKHFSKKHNVPIHKVRSLVGIARNMKQRLRRAVTEPVSIPQWLDDEWRELHKIEKQLFPPSLHIPTYHTITEDHYRVGIAYRDMCLHLEKDSYDYVLFVPWLIPGGADLFAINYANTISALGKTVMVITTNETDLDSTWKTRLDKSVDFVPFGQITSGLTFENKQRLLEQIIENTCIDTIHILNSELGFEFVKSHETYLTASKKRVIATAYSQSTDHTGRIFGFSHSHIPHIYDIATTLTTDNEPVRQMWIDEYAFDPKKIAVHHQPIDSTDFPHLLPSHKPTRKILWAARLAPEKIPNIVHKIADLLPPDTSIHMYGAESKDFAAKDLVTNDRVIYKGAFNSIDDLPIEDYDLYLYTSLFDGMPNTPLEISLTGLPIVAAKVGGLPDFIGDNGYIVADNESPDAYAQAIISVLNHYPQYLEKAKDIEKHTRKIFSRKHFIKEVSDILK